MLTVKSRREIQNFRNLGWKSNSTTTQIKLKFIFH
ncbi:unnamed protein product [Paramecium sonneborni]|uniref:Uncharacterized protein n=1 Tax=Paramecium sonneborni TaxID=65129 RepID=A0A8S1RCZ6_9CILI|nr:unnamed protein product [Paramecium sonneborni]